MGGSKRKTNLTGLTENFDMTETPALATETTAPASRTRNASAKYYEGGTFAIPLSDINVESNVRTDFNPQALTELSESLKMHGQMKPCEVYIDKEGNIFLLTGERRYRSSIMAQFETLDCIIRSEPQNELDRMYHQIVENEQASSFTESEQEEYVTRLTALGEKPETIWTRVNKSKDWFYRVTRAATFRTENPEIVSSVPNLSTAAADALAQVRPEERTEVLENLKEKGSFGRDAINTAKKEVRAKKERKEEADSPSTELAKSADDALNTVLSEQQSMGSCPPNSDPESVPEKTAAPAPSAFEIEIEEDSVETFEENGYTISLMVDTANKNIKTHLTMTEDSNTMFYDALSAFIKNYWTKEGFTCG